MALNGKYTALRRAFDGHASAPPSLEPHGQLTPLQTQKRQTLTPL
jgi:hypothetical protein